MTRHLLYALAIAANGLLCGCIDDSGDTELATSTAESSILPHDYVRNSAGIAQTYSPLGSLRELEATNAFFKNMGTSGRTCVSCHSAEGGWTPSASKEL
jgi:hypothetical protein